MHNSNHSSHKKIYYDEHNTKKPAFEFERRLFCK
jgi:hypothetical protein